MPSDLNQTPISAKLAGFASPLYIMAKPAGASCNLDCKYCYYTEKEQLYSRVDNGTREMSDEMLDLFVRRYIEAQTMREVLFTWHGGEPLLRPISFYRQALRLQQHYGPDRLICNCIQTNGTLITDEWCRFFKDNNWLVGVSIDGPERYHDAYRRNKGGGPTFAKVMHGIELLNKYGVEWNAMAVVNNLVADHPHEFYGFFKSIDCHYIQFAPIVERIKHGADGRRLACANDTEPLPMTDTSVTPEQWGDFLCALFDEWVRTDVGTYFIQIFDATLANWAGEAPGVCIFSESCGHAGVMEYNGDVYSCDHFVFPEYKLGNLRSQTFVEMMYSARQQRFGADKSGALPRQCRECEYLFACHGECPKNRFCTSIDGEPGLNYLCKGYHQFFEHSSPHMKYMKELLDQGLPPSKVMTYET